MQERACKTILHAWKSVHTNIKFVEPWFIEIMATMLKDSKVITSLSMGKAIDSDIKQYKEIRKLTRWQGEHYSVGCLLDYDYVKNHYRLITVDLSTQKDLDVDPKAIQQTECVRQIKKLDAEDNATDGGNNDQSMFVLTTLQKIKSQD